jgi:uncharacterized protein (TIGR02284 family)
VADNQTIAELNRLIRICLDGEAGFLVVAESVRNRGLKALFKTYAQQRAQFADRLAAEVKHLGGAPRADGSALANIHRGWINIKTAMTIGQYGTENVALSESSRGERTAVRTYERTLAKSLPSQVKTVVEEQFQQVQSVSNQIQQMRGSSGTRMVVRLFDRDEDAERAITALHDHGFTQDQIQVVDIGQVITIYQGHGRGNATAESASAGALGGMTIGALLGLIFGLTSLVVPQIDLMGMMGDSLAALVIASLAAGAGVGAGFGALFGAIIGRGTIEEDQYLYAESVARGHVLLTVQTDSKRAKEASDILLQINAARSSRPQPLPSV